MTLFFGTGIKTSVTIDGQKLMLLRMDTSFVKLHGQLIAWQVSNDKLIVGYVAQYKNPFYMKRVGHQYFPSKFWLTYKQGNLVVGALTRGEALMHFIKDKSNDKLQKEGS